MKNSDTRHRDDNILYDLSVHAEWPAEAETLNRCNRSEQPSDFTTKIKSVISGTAWLLMRSVGAGSGSNLTNGLPASLVRLINSQMTWNIAVSINRQYVAIMRTNLIEIRCITDDYVNVLGKCSLPADLRPQWRCLTWNSPGDLLAVSSSDGQVQVFDLVGTQICNITTSPVPHPAQPTDLSKTIASLVFKDTKSKKYLSELLVITHKGILKCYLISEGGAELVHKFSFAGHYPNGIGSVVYQEVQSLLYIGGSTNHSITDSKTNKKTDVSSTDPICSLQYGLTAWRVLSDSPHYKLSTNYTYDRTIAQNSMLMNKLRSWNPFSWSSGGCQDGVYKLALSPNGTILAAVHFSGAFSLWDVPSLRNRAVWTEQSQPLHKELNPTIAENPKRRKVLKEYLHAYNITDVNWWSNDCVILCRGTGSLCLSSATTLDNLLGASPEWFEPSPTITPAYDEAFLALECEIRAAHKRSLDDTGEYDSEEEQSLLTKSTGYAKKVLYYVTDSERFQPPKKRAKKVHKTYRMVCLKSTTPEELYTRKIESEEYGEALMLAKSYGLDCDLVYQQQWRKTEVTVASIQDYLSKISKRTWVLHECLERVPENIDSMKELLLYGLRGTDLQALIAITEPENSERFVSCREQSTDSSFEEYNDNDEDDIKKAAQSTQRAELMKKIDFNNLTLAQKELCHARRKILSYLDRLSTYEVILGGAHAAEERYESKVFAEFRQKNIVQAAVDYARTCDWQAVDVIFTYHGSDTLPHRLAILSNFPETCSPFEFRSLLPTISENNMLESYPECSWRDNDWCEETECREGLGLETKDVGVFLKEMCDFYQQYYGTSLSSSQISAWYSERCYQIEELACQVDNATELVKLARERYVEGLDNLYDDLLTMETLVYDCHLQTPLTFKELCKMSSLEKVKLIMSTSDCDRYIKTMRTHLLPFLQRCDVQNPSSSEQLLHEYLVDLASDGLEQCLLVFQSSKSEHSHPIITDEVTQITLALECIYACKRSDQLSNAFGILECLPVKGFGRIPEVLVKMHRQLDELECHLAAAEILENINLPQEISFFKNSQHDLIESEKLFIKLTRVTGRKEGMSESDWKKLFANILDLRNKVYQCVSTARCFEIFIESLLCSGRYADIKLAGSMIHLKKTDLSASDSEHLREDSTEGQLMYKVSYDRGVELIVTAAKEYMDSSTVLDDETMVLAKNCLDLVYDISESIQEELDLIEGLRLLSFYGVQTLPLQVRMCSSRIDYVQRAMNAQPLAYRKAQKLLQLGHLLRVSQEKVECEGLVLCLVAQHAIKDSDFDTGYKTCKRLMMMSYKGVWKECLQLAQSDQFTNVQIKMELLSFAVTHCEPEMIGSILNAKCLLQSQILYDKVHNKMSTSDSAIEQPFSATTAIQHTKDLLLTTTKTTQSVLTHVGNRKWWKQVLTSIGSDGHSQRVNRTKNVSQQQYYSFYDPNCENLFEDLDKEYKPINAQMTELIFRNCKLEEMLTNGETMHPSVEVLVQLAVNTMSHDTALAVGYLLALPQTEGCKADGCFTQLTQVGMTFHIAAYYYALRIYQCLKPEQTDDLLLHPPSDVINIVSAFVENNQKKLCDTLVEFMERFSSWHDLYMDYNQGQILLGLNRGVDVTRFTQDQEYKNDTILGLAMTSDPSVFDIAISLSQRYNLPMWDVYMTHLEFLFDSELSTSELESRVKDLKILPVLHKDIVQFHERMNKYVLTSVSGTDHAKLIYFYTLLKGKDLPNSNDKLSPDVHLELLKKINNTAKDLDYKELLSEKTDPLDVIRPVLNKNNVHALAKLASKIPSLSGGTLKPSVVFCAWSLQLFWQGKEMQSAWVKQFDSCKDFTDRLSPKHFLQFVDGIVFVEDSLKYMDLTTRNELLNKALKYLQRKESGEQSGRKKVWTDIIDEVAKSKSHLKMLQSSPAMQSMKHSDNGRVQHYADQLDLSKSEKYKVDELLVDMLLDGQDLSLVQTISDILPELQCSIHTTITKALSSIIDKARSESDSWVNVFKSLIRVVKNHQEQGSSLVSIVDILTLLHPLIIDKEIDVYNRIDVLVVIEQDLALSDSDRQQLIFYQTEALVGDLWPDVNISVSGTVEDSQRNVLFTNLLDTSTSLVQYQHLIKLLQVWPALESTNIYADSPRQHPWCNLVDKLIVDIPAEAEGLIVNLMKYLKKHHQFSKQCLEHTYTLLCDSQLTICAIKSVFILGANEMFDKVVQHIKESDQVYKDEELYILLLQNYQLSSLVTTSYYEHLIALILSRQTESDIPYYLQIDTVANQLNEAGLQSEAASLIMQSKCCHPGLSVYGHTWNVIKNWMQ